MDRIYTYQEIQNLISPVMRKYGVSRAYLFGSYSRGEATPESDIDLRVDCDRLKGLFGLGGLYADLERACGKKVDLVTSGAMNHPANIDKVREFRDSIKEDERLIYEEGY